ncbi:thymidylate synthase [Thermodesulforhabdus norvegica]|uniref:Thymidylate synthase n=1 Tax=Thermodesulforhabdus norvegica TaxID=39841 RepID=A0A1I4SM66_9BACT|nr:thymidylate synthase [Thermodesulforhabdus norvegica]SFM65524.1 thymidylate synthase [Thermodesulforhabdus norvegica]
MEDRQEFIPLYWKDQLVICNPYGTVGIITLWSATDYVINQLTRAGLSLNGQDSPVAVVGTLYGNGLRELLRNLLYNPQIDTLIIYGRNRSHSADELIAFFERGVEELDGVEIGYEPLDDGTIPKPVRILGTGRIIDNLVKPSDFVRKPKILFPGEPPDRAALDKVKEFISRYEKNPAPLPPRKVVPLPRMIVNHYPGNPRIHTIWADDPLTAWRDLIHRLYCFGRPVVLKKGRRRELQNVKVVVEKPEPVPEEDLRKHGFDPELLERYGRNFLDNLLPEDTSYSYGHRIRAYFGFDQIDRVVRRLRRDPEDRKCYVVLWDPARDLSEEVEGRPCLVSVFFRKFEDRLTLTATFRTHNALDAWLVNFYGLMALQKKVSHEVALAPGAITVISHSISIDEAEIDRAAMVASEREFRYRLDPMGYFRISLDGDAILVEYRTGDVTLKTYRHRKATRLQHEIARDAVISDINHAIYLGRQLERAERCLREGLPFEQD